MDCFRVHWASWNDPHLCLTHKECYSLIVDEAPGFLGTIYVSENVQTQRGIINTFTVDLTRLGYGVRLILMVLQTSFQNRIMTGTRRKKSCTPASDGLWDHTGLFSENQCRDYEWHVQSGLCGCGHFQVILTSDANEENFRPNTWNFCRVDRQTFRGLCQSQIRNETVICLLKILQLNLLTS